MDDENKLDEIQSHALIEVSYSCSDCGLEMWSEDEHDTDGYSLAEVLLDEGWRVVDGELLCKGCQ